MNALIEIAVFATGQMIVFFVFLARLSSRVAVLESKIEGIEDWVGKVEARQWSTKE